MIRLFLLTVLWMLPTSNSWPQQLPDSIRNAGLTVVEVQLLESEIERVSEEASVSKAALFAIAEALFEQAPRGGMYDVASILDEIRERAGQVAELQAQLNRLASTGQSPDSALIKDAREAFSEGNLEVAEARLGQAIELQEEQLLVDLLRISIIYMQRGILSSLRNDNRLAEVYLDRALDGFYEVAKQINAEENREAWAQTQIFIGDTIVLLKTVNEERSVLLAVTAYSEALIALRFDSEPEVWLRTQRKLADLMIVIQGQSDNSAKTVLLIADQVLDRVSCEVYPAECSWAYRYRGNSMASLVGSDTEYEFDDIRQEYTRALQFIDRSVQTQEWAETKALEGIFLSGNFELISAADALAQAEAAFLETGDAANAKKMSNMLSEVNHLLEQLEPR